MISDGAGLTAGTKPFPDPKEEREEKKKKTGSSFREEKKAFKNVGEKLLRN